MVGGPLVENFFTTISDYNLGTLLAGTHTLKIVADSGNAVTESSETDNEYTKTIAIGGEPEIRIAPLTLAFSVTNGAGGFAASAMMAESAEEQSTVQVSVEAKLQPTKSGVAGCWSRGGEGDRESCFAGGQTGPPAMGLEAAAAAVASSREGAAGEVLAALAADGLQGAPAV